MQTDRYYQAKKITLIGALINALLGVLKVIGGILFVSDALLADGVHSFSDLFTDIMVLLASKFGSLEADENHPYGHQRIETAATLLLAQVLILTGFAIAWHAVSTFLHQAYIKPHWLALPIALISIIANEILFYYTKHVGNKIHSALLIANAWHHRSDAASSLVVAIGILGSLLGLVYFDALAAVIVGLLIVKMGISYGWNSIKELVDTAIEPQNLSTIENIIQEVEGVHKIHQLRTRHMGKDIFIDVHVLVSPFISVSEGHYIAQHVHDALRKKIMHVKDVTVHIDPEDDEIACPSFSLPDRKTIEEAIKELDTTALEKIMIHYLNGEVYLDLICKKVSPRVKDAFLEKVTKALPQIKHIRSFTV